MKILKAEYDDLQTILELQFLAYQSEAELLNNYEIPPLVQTISEIRNEYANGVILKAVDDSGVIIGSVRAYQEYGTVYIGKLIVHPKDQKKGIGSALLGEIETACPSARYELFTSDKSKNNLRLYEKLGYHRFKEQEISSILRFVFLEKK
ncbi:MAG: GNAT family N-acetyltransferase [Syntrophomonas sp.]